MNSPLSHNKKIKKKLMHLYIYVYIVIISKFSAPMTTIHLTQICIIPIINTTKMVKKWLYTLKKNYNK